MTLRVARLARAEEAYADDKNVTEGLERTAQSFFHPTACFVDFGCGTMKQNEIRYSATLDLQMTKEDSLMNNDYGNGITFLFIVYLIYIC